MGREIQRGDVTWVHSKRDIKLNNGRPERVIGVERYQPDERGQHFHKLLLEPLQGGHPRPRYVSVREHFVVKPL